MKESQENVSRWHFIASIQQPSKMFHMSISNAGQSLAHIKEQEGTADCVPRIPTALNGISCVKPWEKSIAHKLPLCSVDIHIIILSFFWSAIHSNVELWEKQIFPCTSLCRTETGINILRKKSFVKWMTPQSLLFRTSS